MHQSIFKTIISSFLIFSLLSAHAFADKKDHDDKHEKDMLISQVTVDFDSGEIYITGKNLTRKKHTSKVALAGTELTVSSATSDLIIALLEPGTLAGDYLLTVSTGRGESKRGSYDLTIGAVGPKGDTGATGATGSKGDAGATGPKGDAGVNGAPGKDGAVGPKGDAGAAGADGADGAQGATGRAGAKGLPGLFELEYVSSIFTIAINTPTYLLCPNNKRIIAGGARILTPGVALSASYPDNGNSWVVELERIHTVGGEVEVYAICAKTAGRN